MEKDLPQSVLVATRIDRRRDDGSVSQRVLDEQQIARTAIQVHRERVA
jgi:hypothetical protein